MIPVPDYVLQNFLYTYSIRPEGLRDLGGIRSEGDGALYEYSADDTPRILKILAVAGDKTDGLARIRSRVRFANFLGNRQVPIVHPKLSPQGRLLEICLADNHTFVAYIMDKAAGKIVHPPQWNGTLYRHLGRIIGMMHRITKDYPAWLHPLYEETGGAGMLGWQEEWQSFYQWCQDEEVKERWISVRERLAKLPVERSAFGFIHNDPHPYNMLVDGENITVLDFDVANCHWFMTDIAIATQGVLFSLSGGLDRPVTDPAPLRRFLLHFRAGYEEEYSLAEEWWQLLDLFIGYRRILLFTVFHEQLLKKPEALATWKQMIATEPALLADR